MGERLRVLRHRHDQLEFKLKQPGAESKDCFRPCVFLFFGLTVFSGGNSAVLALARLDDYCRLHQLFAT